MSGKTEIAREASSSPLDAIPDEMPFDVPYGIPISRDRAQAVIHAAMTEAKKRNWKMNVAVADSGGNLVAFQRMDGAMLASIQIAEHKARAAATFRAQPGSSRMASILCIPHPGWQPADSGMDSASHLSGWRCCAPKAQNRTTDILFSRRDLYLAPPLALLSSDAAAEPAPIPSSFPAHPPEVIRELVTVAHGNIKRLKELVDARPALAKAAIDWGFGDWEDALGAASHVGNREIAEYLIAHSARPTLFSATMLGQLDVVMVFIAGQPGAQRIPGPHSISLLAHAKNGGKAAEPVQRFLESLGDAGTPEYPRLSTEEAAALVGIYAFEPGGQIEITGRAGSSRLRAKARWDGRCTTSAITHFIRLAPARYASASPMAP